EREALAGGQRRCDRERPRLRARLILRDRRLFGGFQRAVLGAARVGQIRTAAGGNFLLCKRGIADLEDGAALGTLDLLRRLALEAVFVVLIARMTTRALDDHEISLEVASA